MASFNGAIYDDDARRALVRCHPTLNGIDYLEVTTAPAADNQRLLRVVFLPPEDPATAAKLDALLTELLTPPFPVTISGGVRVTDLRIEAVMRAGNSLLVRVDRPGDFTAYTLALESGRLDPLFSQVDFNFKAGCPSRFDCRSRSDCPPEHDEAPAIDYMAKDYASFRQALIDLIPNLVPGWAERRPADLAMTLLELLAYTGDQLSYFQDAVANEAYLETARQRISVRRHVRLIDYAMHDGLSAATFVQFTVGGPPGTRAVVSDIPAIQILTRPPGLPIAPGPVPPDLVDLALDTTDAVFEVLIPTGGSLTFHASLNEIAIHSWGSESLYLPRGTTNAYLVGTRPLKAGDLLLFEEVKDPERGLAADLNPAHRQVVRLTHDGAPVRDELLSVDLTHVAWAEEDALRFPLCVASVTTSGEAITGISVARGNLALAIHGRTFHQKQHISDLGTQSPVAAYPGDLRKYRFSLGRGPLSFHGAQYTAPVPVATLQAAAPGGAIPAILQLTERDEGVAPVEWQAVMPDLLASSRFATHVTVETDNLGRAQLRFGDGQFGMPPAPGATFDVAYRVGVGAVGNVGADSLRYFVQASAAPGLLDITEVRNPLPAWGGTDSEPIERVKQLAPAAFHADTLRAVTEADYAVVAEQHPQVRRAVATFRWTGSWHTVFVAIDPSGTADLSPELRAEILSWIGRFRLAGYDLEVSSPVFVPLMVDLEVCAAAGYFPSNVEQALYAALGSRPLAGGANGFFHPDNFTFSQPLYLSRLYAAVERVAGVASARVTRFARRYEADPEPSRPATRRNLDSGQIVTERLEIIRLDNDSSFPEYGVLKITVA